MSTEEKQKQICKISRVVTKCRPVTEILKVRHRYSFENKFSLIQTSLFPSNMMQICTLQQN